MYCRYRNAVVIWNAPKLTIDTASATIFLLGVDRPRTKELFEKALPLMHKLSDDIQQSCHLVVPSDEFTVVIARVESPSEHGLVVRIRLLLEATSGLVLVANQPEGVRAHWIRRYGGSAHRQTRSTIVDTIDSIRKQGYAAIPSTSPHPSHAGQRLRPPFMSGAAEFPSLRNLAPRRPRGIGTCARNAIL